ncbi:hypothetical protein RVBP17_1000 [Pseudomonas phage sp. 30-3]|uniref:Uncharacterized protein n=1 Tax=Pseudomonas phage vB_PaeM_PA5oct TaxID=2163605 RepID=A0A4Y5JVC0_9CAUD|nr:hypothetical protein PQE65_gp294 [Pseudomonas phage vB_PaeM_PA5oct]QCG76071.1 hypothetical protein EST35_0190 [Pseudomonas phage vB_PaeM_PA5oct]BDR25857.1 hypothetical protein RVBP16_2970 [Pseudomonas phage sp. 30-2]BDR26057.1 hypothetical protein RVBP17_1000 [Pseudomonas phage sp. 30-3]VOH53629.1 hypothetical protein MIJ3_00031 [Pseudomonas phage vB_PaeM_MIJ3]
MNSDYASMFIVIFAILVVFICKPTTFNEPKNTIDTNKSNVANDSIPLTGNISRTPGIGTGIGL